MDEQLHRIAIMNELEFKRHIKDLVHGHHHPEEHDWSAGAAKPARAGRAKTASGKRGVRKKSSKRG